VKKHENLTIIVEGTELQTLIIAITRSYMRAGTYPARVQKDPIT